MMDGNVLLILLAVVWFAGYFHGRYDGKKIWNSWGKPDVDEEEDFG
jgi:hypothetical protein